MKFPRLFAFLIAGSSIVFAQMGGMPGGGMGPGQGNPTNPTHPAEPTAPTRTWMDSGHGDSSTPAGSYMRMFRNMGGTPMMGSGMGFGMTDDMTVGPDGTAYVIRSISTAQPSSATASSWQLELDAISPVDGAIKWKLPLSGERASSPTLASDGLIYLTVDNYQMFYANYNSGGSMMSPSQAQANRGQVLVVSASGGSASIMNTIQTGSDVLSAPRIVPDSASGYMVYVLGYDMMSWTSTPASTTSTFAPGQKTLYAYRPDGSTKFTVKLP